MIPGPDHQTGCPDHDWHLTWSYPGFNLFFHGLSCTAIRRKTDKIDISIYVKIRAKCCHQFTVNNVVQFSKYIKIGTCPASQNYWLYMGKNSFSLEISKFSLALQPEALVNTSGRVQFSSPDVTYSKTNLHHAHDLRILISRRRTDTTSISNTLRVERLSKNNLEKRILQK